MKPKSKGYIKKSSKPNRKKEKIVRKHKHFWNPLSGWQIISPENVSAGEWGVRQVYCAYCLKVKDL